ncbi:hypothetical protein [Megalodesulfovibrio paquesii]
MKKKRDLLPNSSPANKQDGRAKFGKKKQLKLLSLFALDLDATSMARSLDCSRNTVNSHVAALRRSILEHCREHMPLMKHVHPGDTFFQLGLVKGGGKAPHREPPALLGVLPQDCGIVVEILPEREDDALRCLRHSRFWIETFSKGSFCPQSWKQDMVILDVSMLMARSAPAYEPCDPFTTGPLHREPPTQRMARFLQYAMVRLEKFRGLQAHTLHLHLKETEFRFNHPGMSLYAALRDLQ